MNPDPLATVLKLRKRAVDLARGALADAIRANDQAEAKLRARTDRIEVERRRAADTSAGDHLVEAFAAWLPEGRREMNAARTEQEARSAELSRRRAELSGCEVALETIETLLRRRAQEATAAELRRGQQILDEAAMRRAFRSC